MLKSGISVWCYTAPGQSYYPPNIVDYSRLVESLTFTTLAPGGYGQLNAKLNVATSRIPRSELALFSHIAVMAPAGYMPLTGTGYALFLGEITQPELAGDQNGEYFNLQALGMGNCLRDDPRNVTYNAQTAFQIITAEMTAGNRANWMPLSTDQSQVFPNLPGISLSPSYMGYAMEDILNDVCLLAGDYQWGVWSHPTQQDANQFPLAQLYVHLRNTTTINYQAFIGAKDVESWRITPSADRAYNVMTIYYTDASNSNSYNFVTTTDSRLTGTSTQGTAPFRYRKYLQDFTGTTTVTATQASSIEATQLAIMKDPTNKTQVVLRSVRNAGGQPIPLWVLQADNTIEIPELAQRAQVISVSPVPGVQLFYILSTKYSEDSSGAMSVELQLDNWYDYAATRLARLELAAYRKAASGATAAGVQSLGSPSTGSVGYQAYNASAGATFGTSYTYSIQLARTPTSITLSGGVTTNAASIAVSSITSTSFFFGWTATLSGQTQATRNFATVGNCLLAVDLEAGTFTHHCDGCGHVREHLLIASDIRVEAHEVSQHALCIDCPTCGMVECLNTGLTEADEDPEGHPHHAGQASLIRQLQRHTGLQKKIEQKRAGATHAG